MKQTRTEIPWTTLLLITINILIFLLETLAGGSENPDVAIRFGAMYTPYILMQGEWYRLVTAMFVHFGFEHLASNMLALMVEGPIVERYYGKIRFLAIYGFAGISGNLATMAWDILSGTARLSAGASGGIFGLTAVFLIFAMLPELRRLFPLKRVLFSILISLSPALEDGSINLIAHLGGLLGGFVIAGCFEYIKSRHYRKYYSSH